ncbi:sulfite exporter TauE/SafE family protein [Roseibium aggregatum]|uniref:Probable membrane transporter protein n=1 Tax=Roseibium aggregatum TaxID=187304 RepID=A0A926SAL9_9HYPH|nr:sulfite exporter TauE/SafE family protein [Roseibium aggregatum]MBD1549459.1 sulfite exporter TauE/SafE family protein [Roseibium aggregatum]
METFFDTLLPHQLSPAISLLLIAISFVTSALTAAIGLGGGIALIAIMANVMPVAALVPVHGVIQFGSNVSRALVLIRYIDWSIIGWFAAGAVCGAALGGSVAVTLPAPYLRLGIACFVLWTVWGKPPKLERAKKPAMAAAGLVATLFSMFFGATGPIGASVLSTLGLTRHQFVANQGATALLMHLMKIIAFGLLGFAFAPWLGLIVFMIISGFFGTLFGSRLLGRMQEATFKKGFKVIMTLLALNLLRQAGEGLFFS